MKKAVMGMVENEAQAEAPYLARAIAATRATSGR